MSIDKEKLAEIMNARDVLCEFCEATGECGKCRITYLVYDAYYAAEEEEEKSDAFFFHSTEEMLDAICNETGLYNPKMELYVFCYIEKLL